MPAAASQDYVNNLKMSGSCKIVEYFAISPLTLSPDCAMKPALIREARRGKHHCIDSGIDMVRVRDCPSSSSETEIDFPFLCSKPGGGEGKRTKGKRCDSAVARGAPPTSVVKVLDDPANALGKRRKARILQKCADNYYPGVGYSLDKKNRWSQDPATLLDGIDDSEVSGQVVERRYVGPVCRWTPSKVFAVHEMGEDGEVTSKTIKGNGALLCSLLSPQREKKRGCRARRELAAKLALEEEERNGCPAVEEPEKAKIRYTLLQEAPVYYGAYMRRAASPKSRRARVKRVDVSDLEQSELEQSVHIEEDGYKPSRDLNRDRRRVIAVGGEDTELSTRFCLGDYMTDKVSGLIHAGRERTDSSKHLDIEQVELPESETKPFELVDLSSVLRAPATFEFAHIYTDNWKEFNFVDQVESLREKYVVRWLDSNYQRVLIDVTPAFACDREYEGARIAILTIERCRNKNWHYLRILLNTTFSHPQEFDWKTFKKFLSDKNVHDIPSLVAETVALPLKWCKHDVEDTTETTRLKQRKEYLPQYNVAAFSQPVQRVTFERMAGLLREECEHLEADTFEKVEQDDFESELEDVGEISQFDSLPTLPAGVKCGTCGTVNTNDLFELDDCWMCRDCLKQVAINQIRVKCLPIRLTLVVPPGTTSYDVLPSILPLRLFNFYTKLAALELIELSIEEDTDLGECPGCNQAVEINQSNEYGCVHCECGVVWCSECKKEPHWPMSCDTASEWAKRWLQQDLDRSQRLREVTCRCRGSPILFGELDNFAECKNCGVGFNPQNMYTVTTYGRPCSRPDKFVVLSDRILPNEYVPRIKKEVVEVCSKARNYRFDSSKWNELEKASRELKATSAEFEKLREIRQMVLYIVEYGTAWVHMEKDLSDRAVIRANLCQLLRLYEDVITTVVYKRSNFAECVESLNSAVQKTIELIKRSI